MPLRPFPYQLGVGIDITSITRFVRILEKGEQDPEHLNRFLRRLFTPREKQEFKAWYRYVQLTDAHVDAPRLGGDYLAGRWAAKEATMKAASAWRRLSFHDIVIVRPRKDGGTFAVILDPAAPEDGSESTPDPKSSRLGQGVEDANQTDHMPVITTPMTSSPNNDEAAVPECKANHSDPTKYVLPSDSREASNSFASPYADYSGQIAKISISHDGAYATAVCLAAEGAASGDVGGEAAAREPS